MSINHNLPLFLTATSIFYSSLLKYITLLFLIEIVNKESTNSQFWQLSNGIIYETTQNLKDFFQQTWLRVTANYVSTFPLTAVNSRAHLQQKKEQNKTKNKNKTLKKNNKNKQNNGIKYTKISTSAHKKSLKIIYTCDVMLLSPLADQRGAPPARAPPTGSISFVFTYVFAEKCMRRR